MSMVRAARFVALFLGWLAAGSAPAVAQSNLGTITGVVTDTTGSVLVGAEVTVTRSTTAQPQTTTVNEAGVYLMSGVVAGSYRVTVSAQGFKTVSRDIVVDAAQRLRLDITLEPGDIAETVVVETARPLLTRESGEISETIDAAQMASLPLAGRVPYGALIAAAGVATGNTDPTAGGDTFSGNISLSGSRPFTNAFTLDGASLVHIGGIGERVGSIEAMQEVKVLTNAYSAEYGRTSGASISFQTKSGTDQYRGSVYEFHRDSRLDATNWQNNATGVPQAELRRDEFGATLGGPMPAMKHRMFFFFSYEGVRDKIPTNRTRTIPDPRLRRGDFSWIPAVQSGAIRIIDPRTGEPFPGNVIPSDRLDPAALRVLDMFPAPNTAGIEDTRSTLRTSNWIRTGQASDNKNFFVSRVDWNATSKDKIFATFSHINEGPQDLVVDFDNALNSIQGPRGRNIRRGTFGYNRFLGGNLASEAMFFFQRDPRDIQPWHPELDAARELGIQRYVGAGMPTIDIGNYGVHGNSAIQHWIYQPAGVSNILTWLRGRHSVRFGGQFYFNAFQYNFTSPNSNGVYRFNGEITGGVPGRANLINPIADFLLGAVKTAEIPVAQQLLTRKNYNLGLFINDDWKVTNNLTVNLGLRYEFDTRPFVSENIYSRIDTQTGQLLVAGQNASRTLDLRTDFANFSPRLGLAYALNERTVVRSGFAIFHSTLWPDNGEMVTYPGWTSTRLFPDPGTGRAQAFTLREGFPLDGVGDPPDPLAQYAAATQARPLSVGSLTFNADDPLPYHVQWNLGVQREVGFSTMVEVSYVGNRGVDLSRRVPANLGPLSRSAEVAAGAPAQAVRPFPNLSAFDIVNYDGFSQYHGLQVKATRRFTAGVSLDANYTLSKYTDSGSFTGNGRNLVNVQRPDELPRLEYGLSSLDRRHVFSLAWIWELPFGRGQSRLNSGLLSAIAGGWQINGLFSAADGLPLTITQTKANNLLDTQRPDLVEGRDASGRLAEPVIEGAALRWLVPVTSPDFAFTPSGAAGIGTLGRNTSRGPGFWNVNLGVFRRFRLTDRYAAEVRFEAFNAFNRVNWSQPNTNISTGTYGLITSAGAARQIQLGARFTF
jgi:hypothetical protein